MGSFDCAQDDTEKITKEPSGNLPAGADPLLGMTAVQRLQAIVLRTLQISCTSSTRGFLDFARNDTKKNGVL